MTALRTGHRITKHQRRSSGCDSFQGQAAVGWFLAPVLGATIAEVSFSDSSMQYCPACQTGGKVLADRRMSKLLK